MVRPRLVTVPIAVVEVGRGRDWGRVLWVTAVVVCGYDEDAVNCHTHGMRRFGLVGRSRQAGFFGNAQGKVVEAWGVRRSGCSSSRRGGAAIRHKRVVAAEEAAST